MSEKIRKFMIGRNGPDEFTKFLTWVTFGVLLIGMILSFTLRGIAPIVPLVVFAISILLLVFQYWRVFSKNIPLQQKMNRWYTTRRYKLQVKLQKVKDRRQQAKFYRFFKCPNCAQKVRVPKGRGKIMITCPKCKTEFIKVS